MKLYNVRWTVFLGVVLFGMGLILAACTAFGWPGQGIAVGRRFSSNGEQIYFTATSQRGGRITSDTTMGMMGRGMMGRGMMGGGALACASCHGPDGRGGRVGMMMSSFVAPDIRYKVLTAEEMDHDEGEDHPPYTDESIKRAITQGMDPAGEPLAWPMPRWRMSEADLADLVDYLKRLP